MNEDSVTTIPDNNVELVIDVSCLSSTKIDQRWLDLTNHKDQLKSALVQQLRLRHMRAIASQITLNPTVCITMTS